MAVVKRTSVRSPHEGHSEPPQPFPVKSANLANLIAVVYTYYEDNKVRRHT